MKKVLFLILILVFIQLHASEYQPVSSNANAFTLNSSNLQNTDITFVLDKYEFIDETENNKTYTRISCEGSSEFAQPGLPDLPRFTQLIAIPDNGNVTFTITEIEENITDQILIYPRQDLQSESVRGDQQFVINSEYYEQGDLFPQQQVVVGDPAILRDIRIVSVTVNPFRYDPQTRQLHTISRIRINIRADNERGDNPKTSDHNRSRFFTPLYESVILNYSEISGREDNYQEPSYLFIYPNNNQVEDNLQLLLDWKHEKGFIVNAASTSQTGSTSNQILSYISDAYDSWENPPEFVCLVGDAGGSFNIPTGHMNGGEGDHFYTMLEGNDLLSDVYIGRLSFNSITQFQTILNKIFNYEKNPYLTTTDWYNNAVLVGDPGASGPSTVDTKMHVKDLINYYTPQIECTEVYSGSYTSYMTSNLNSGVSYFNYRGFGGMSGWNTNYINNLSNGYMLPVAIAITCNTGDFEGTYDSISETFLKAGSPSVPKGAIGAVSTATGQTHTCFNNCMDAGIYYGFFADGLHSLGGAFNRGKINLHINYPDNPSNQVMNFSYWNNLMGDPGLEVWSAIPQPMNIIFESDIAYGANFVEIFVENEEGSPLSNAWTTILLGNDEIFATGFTNESGAVTLPVDALTTGEVTLTVTKHNFIPFQGSFTITDHDQFVGIGEIAIDDDNNGSSSGNDDGLVNPGEIIELNILLHNYGLSDVSGVSALLTSENELVTISDEIEDYGDISSGSSVVSFDDFDIQISEAAAGGQIISFELIITDADRNQWRDIFDLQIAGSILHSQGYEVFDDNNNLLEPGESAQLSFTLTNLGLTGAEDVYGTLTCENYHIEISDDTGYFGDIFPDEEISNTADNFELTVSTHVIQGTQIPLQLNLYNSTGLSQDLTVLVQIGEITVTDPLGPDAFGYYCYDDDDTSYNSPVYNWIEISPEMGGPGVEINMNDWGDMGVVETIDLPFTLTFYDEEYNTIAISSNGWIRPGTTAVESFMNWSIPGALGPSPLIAPFWDDLVTSAGDISYYYSAENNFFVIEWNNMRSQYNNDEETFQTIIYDQIFYPTSNGNNEIKFQYKEINNVDQGQYGGWTIQHGQYATVGLEDHTASRGLEYTFNDTYPTAAKPLEDEMAILFTGPPIYQDEPYLLVGGLEIDDPNDNGSFDYGEMVDLFVNLNNLGNQSATDLSAQLVIDDDYVTVINDNSLYPDIPGGGLIQNTTPFSVQVSGNCPDGHIVQADLNVTGLDYNWELRFTFILNAPTVVFSSMLINDGENNILDPGETSDVLVTLHNIGGAGITNGTLNIASEDNFITINENSYEIADIDADGSAVAIFNVTASDSATIGYQCPVNWNLTSDHEYSTTGMFNIVISMVPVYLEESFNTFPPEDWSISPNSNWVQGTWNQSGGTPPEAQFNWYPQNDGDQRLISEPVNTLGSLSLELEFKHSVSHFTGTYQLLIQTSSDGDNWITAHSYPAGNINPTTENINISTDDVGSEEFRFAFCFSGNSYNINNWWLDDVVLTSVQNDNYGYLEGDVTLLNGTGNVEEVLIRAGNYSISPDATGHYMMPLAVGIYNISAVLEGYSIVTENDMEIELLQTTTVNFNLQFLDPPFDLEAAVNDDDVSLSWEYEIPSSEQNSGKSPIISTGENIKDHDLRNLIGFNIYRNDELLVQLNNPEELNYLDEHLPDGEYFYYITAQYDEGESIRSNEVVVNIDFSDLTDDEIVIKTELSGNYPNPFNPETVISFALTCNDAKSATLEIYNLRGQKIRSFECHPELVEGIHSVIWNGTDDNGSAVSSGVYFYTLRAGEFVSVKKMLLMK
ncbi:C25 family cysteine peptidase [Candidatus Cloacimonadota bacterium]